MKTRGLQVEAPVNEHLVSDNHICSICLKGKHETHFSVIVRGDVGYIGKRCNACTYSITLGDKAPWGYNEKRKHYVKMLRDIWKDLGCVKNF
jgi:hypothetical protein